MVAILLVATGLVSGCAASRGSATIRPGPAELEDPGSEDWVRELGSDRPQARAWALSEIESHYEAARQRGEDAERRLRDQLVEPLVEAYLRRFPSEPSVHDEEHWAEMNAEEMRMLELLAQFRDPRTLPAAVVAGGVYSEFDLSGRVALAAEIVRSSGVPTEERGAICRFLLNRISNGLANEGAIYRVLGAVPGTEARQILVSSVMDGILDDSEASRSLLAMPALARRGEPESVDLFIRALFASEGRRPCLQREAFRAASVVHLAMFGRHAYRPLLRLVRGQHESMEATAERWGRARRRCAEGEHSETSPVPIFTNFRDMAAALGIAALGELGDPRAFGVLAEGLQSDNPRIRLLAAEGLRRLERPEVATPLLVGFAVAQRQAPRREQERLVSLLAELGTEQAIASLLTTFRPPTEVVDKNAHVLWGQVLRNYLDLASRAERDAIAQDPQAAHWLGGLRQSAAWQLSERCDLSAHCHLAVLNEALAAYNSRSGPAVSDAALRRHELVIRRVGRGDVGVFLELAKLSQSRTGYVRDFAFRTMMAVGTGDAEIFAVVKGRRRYAFHEELVYRRLRTRRRLN